jgi:hypothetical protein
MKKTPQFKTNSGHLTSYALACGYVERAERDNGNRVSLSREQSIYHVRGFRDGFHFANAFNYIGAARRFFNSLA